MRSLVKARFLPEIIYIFSRSPCRWAPTGVSPPRRPHSFKKKKSSPAAEGRSDRLKNDLCSISESELLWTEERRSPQAVDHAATLDFLHLLTDFEAFKMLMVEALAARANAGAEAAATEVSRAPLRGLQQTTLFILCGCVLFFSLNCSRNFVGTLDIVL